MQESKNKRKKIERISLCVTVVSAVSIVLVFLGILKFI